MQCENLSGPDFTVGFVSHRCDEGHSTECQAGKRVGIQPVLSALPVVGAFVPQLIATYTLFEAAHVGAPPQLLIRFVLRHFVEWLAARVPVLGTMFDAWYKASKRNLEDLEEWLEEARTT